MGFGSGIVYSAYLLLHSSSPVSRTSAITASCREEDKSACDNNQNSQLSSSHFPRNLSNTSSLPENLLDLVKTSFKYPSKEVP